MLQKRKQTPTRNLNEFNKEEKRAHYLVLNEFLNSKQTWLCITNLIIHKTGSRWIISNLEQKPVFSSNSIFETVQQFVAMEGADTVVSALLNDIPITVEK